MLAALASVRGLAAGLFGLALLAGVVSGLQIRAQGAGEEAAARRAGQHLRAAYDPIHFRPAIEQASDAQCLACHREVLEDRVRERSPAGIAAAGSRAGYQQVTTYAGEQDTFHRRHLVSPFARAVMNLACNTCHQGHDPREKAPASSATAARTGDGGFVLRKAVNPETTCLKCHGPLNIQVMGLPAPWHESRELFGQSCLTCHATIRTRRHEVNYLKAAAIEAAGARDAEVCHGCHGGRAWYREPYPYPRHAWPGMPAEVPDWARARPDTSEARFLTPSTVNPR